MAVSVWVVTLYVNVNILKEHAAIIFSIKVSGVRLQSDYKANRKYKSKKSVLIIDWIGYALRED
jgi:hypothetical protein